VEDNTYPDNNHVLWLKTVPLKLIFFVWCLLLNHVPTKNNMQALSGLSENVKLPSF